MSNEQISVQQLYEQFYEESLRRARLSGAEKPNETEVFKILTEAIRAAVANGEPIELLDELAEVKPLKVQAIEAELDEMEKWVAERKDSKIILV